MIIKDLKETLVRKMILEILLVDKPESEVPSPKSEVLSLKYESKLSSSGPGPGQEAQKLI